MRDDVEVGGSFSDALAKHPVDFPPLMINMIRAGETGGFLEGALESLAVNFEKEAKLRVDDQVGDDLPGHGARACRSSP